MWLQYFISLYLIVYIFATRISYDSLDISSSSSTNKRKPYSLLNQHLASNNYRNGAFQSLNFDFTTKKMNQEQLYPGTQLLDSTSAETLMDNIFLSNQQGQNLDGYDQLYADPEIKKALQFGNETIARSFIHTKLCFLGLINCKYTEDRQPYYNPHRDIQDVIYVQPTSKPNDRPLPINSIKRSEVFINKKPRPFVSDPTHLRSGILLFSRPIFHTSANNDQPSLSFLSPDSEYKKTTVINNFKPVYESELEREINYENKFMNKKQVMVETDSSIQQHIHHHFHHNDPSGRPPSINEPRPIDNNNFNNYRYGINLYNNYEEYSKHFKNNNLSSTNIVTRDYLNNNYANRYPLYEKSNHDFLFSEINMKKDLENYKILNPKLGSLNGLVNNIRNDGFGENDFFNNYSNKNIGSNIEFDQNSFISNKLLGTEYNNCICVRYDKCIINQAGRKDDFYLSIDPRNLKKNISADNEEIISIDKNNTMEYIQILNNANKIEQFKNEPNDVQNTSAFSMTTENKDHINKKIKSSETGRAKRHVKNKFINDQKQNIEMQNHQLRRSLSCKFQHVCCEQHQLYPENNAPQHRTCGVKYNQGVAGRIKTPVYIDGDSEFGEYPWQVAILKKELEEQESIYICGGTLLSPRHIITAAHCIKTYTIQDLRVRLGEWDVNHDVEFFPYMERDVISVTIHPEFYAGTLYNDISILKLDYDVDFNENPHISPICLPDKFNDFINTRCWTTGWGKNAFGDFGKYQNILKEVDVPIISNNICEYQMRKTRLGPTFNLHPGFVCAGGEEGKDACKGDGGGPMVCSHNGKWQLAGIVSWGIGCGQAGIPGVYTRVSYYLDWIKKTIKN